MACMQNFSLHLTHRGQLPGGTSCKLSTVHIYFGVKHYYTELCNDLTKWGEIPSGHILINHSHIFQCHVHEEESSVLFPVSHGDK